MKKILILISLFAIFLFAGTVFALPDLTIEDIEFYASKDHTARYIAPENNTTNLQMAEYFFAKPVFKNIGNSETNSRWLYSTYLDGQWINTIYAGQVYSIPDGLNTTQISASTYLVNLAQNQSLPAEYVGTGGAITSPPQGYHNVTIIVNPDNSTAELNYSNNIYSELFYTGAEIPNNPPEITNISAPEQINEGETLTVSFTASDINKDSLSYKILKDGLQVSTTNSYSWQTSDKDNGTYNFTFVAEDEFNATAQDSRLITVNDALCSVNSDCDDGNPETMDLCHQTMEGKACSNYVYNFYGRILDTDTALPINKVNISFYNSSIYDVFNDSGDYSALQPKQIPDAVTDSNGAYKTFLVPTNEYHMVMQHSNENSFNIHAKAKTTNKTIVTETSGYIKVFFEKASAGLKSDLYISKPENQLIVKDSKVGKVVWFNNTIYPAGTELEFFIKVHGTSWGLGEYDHYSNSEYCQIERLDKDTWRLHFEDLPASYPPDWDYNDAVVLVDIVGNVSNETSYDNDCDKDGIKNWVDYDDDWCDAGEHDEEMNENTPEVNFNAEGHILYSGKEEDGNKYVCGDNVRFRIKGINNGDTNETITFLVQDHTSDNTPSAPIFYTGNITNENESLTVNAGEQKSKLFDWFIPCNATEGKYDIHLVWNSEKWHKIGNFFVINDTTPPGIAIIEKEKFALPNKSVSFYYNAWENPQQGTINEKHVVIASTRIDKNLVVKIDKDINIDGPDADIIPDNDVDSLLSGGSSLSFNVSYNQSGTHTIKAIVTDPSGNSAEDYANVTVFITEQEANNIAVPWYNAFNFNDIGFLMFDYDVILAAAGSVSLNADRYAESPEEQIGDEYMTPGNNISSQTDINALNEVLYGTVSGGASTYCTGPEWFQPINPTTAQGYNYTLLNFFCYYDKVCGNPRGVAVCNNTNFAPQVYDWEPKTNPTIGSASSQTFTILSRDANKESVFVDWYLDDNLVNSTTLGTSGGIDTYIFTANASMAGGHTVKAEVYDSADSQDLDEWNFKKTHQWELTVTN